MIRKYSILVLAVIVAGFISCKKADQVVPASGIVNFVTGEVFIVKDGAKAQANPGDMVAAGMAIETGKSAEAEIYFGDNAVKVLEKTVFQVKDMIQNLTQNTEKTELYVEKGKLYSSVRKKLTKDSSYTIKTPTAIAGVRGTEFIINEENGKSNIACSDGKIAVQDASKPDAAQVEINGGQEIDVVPGSDLTPKNISENNRKALEDIKKNFREMKEDIRKQFEQQREEIRENVKKQKEMAREMIDEQKALNKQNVDDVKQEAKANVEAIKGNVNAEKENAKKNLEGVKPDVQSYKSEIQKPDIKSFKPSIEKPSIK